jgi:hypothetical protein
MKKFLLSTITLMFMVMISACTNPSMDEGFERLNKSFEELEAALKSLNLPQMEEDLKQMNIDLAQINYDLTDANGSWAELITELDNLHLQLLDIVEISESWATTEQMQGLLADIQEVGAGIDILVLRADYDYDGVINAIDKCPDTPLTEINNVDAQGCAPGETPEGDD